MILGRKNDLKKKKKKRLKIRFLLIRILPFTKQSYSHLTCSHHPSLLTALHLHFFQQFIAFFPQKWITRLLLPLPPHLHLLGFYLSLGPITVLTHSQRDNVPDPSQDGFIMVVIDGNTHLFLEQLITEGQRGGALATERLVERWITTIPQFLMW